MVERIEDIPEDVLVRVLGSRQRKQVSRPILLDVPYFKYNDRLSVERSKEYNADLDSALVNICNVSRDLLKYVENKKFEFLAEDKLENYLRYAKYYAKYDRVHKVIVDGHVRISLVLSSPEK